MLCCLSRFIRSVASRPYSLHVKDYTGLEEPNGLSQEIVPNLRIFTENWISRLQKADFDDLYTIGSEFASPTRSHTPFPAVSAKNAVSENCYCQNLRKICEKFGTIFCKNLLDFGSLEGQHRQTSDLIRTTVEILLPWKSMLLPKSPTLQ